MICIPIFLNLLLFIVAINLLYAEQRISHTKHIEIDYHFVRTKRQEGPINLISISSYNGVTNMLVKPMHP